MRRFWRALIALAVVCVFVALLMLNTSALVELAWASLAGRFGRRTQVIAVALVLLVVASLAVPFARWHEDPEAVPVPAAPERAAAIKPRVARKTDAPPGDRPKRVVDAAAQKPRRARGPAKKPGTQAKGTGKRGARPPKTPR